MARPKKAVKRDKQYSVRLTIAEAKRIEKSAHSYGISVSAYLRKKGLGDKMKPPISDIESEAFKQLQGIGKNLNQLTRYTHQKKLLTNEVLKLIDLTDKVLKKLA